MIKVSPSILAADPLRMGEEAQKMVDAGCDWLHVDIMDGNFVPNLSYGPSMVKALRRRFTLPLDVHLMILHPEQYAETFIRARCVGPDGTRRGDRESARAAEADPHAGCVPGGCAKARDSGGSGSRCA